jgi:hypothetical protein
MDLIGGYSSSSGTSGTTSSDDEPPQKRRRGDGIQSTAISKPREQHVTGVSNPPDSTFLGTKDNRPSTAWYESPLHFLPLLLDLAKEGMHIWD